jgi:hypothetical protein
MANEQNLKPFQKGTIPNPNGRPKGSRNRSTVARKWLEAMQDSRNPITGEIENLSQEDIMTLALLNKARKGDVNAYKQLMDSGYGLPKQQVENTIIEQPLFPEQTTNE